MFLSYARARYYYDFHIHSSFSAKSSSSEDMLTGDWKGPSGRPSWGTHDHQVDIKHIYLWPKWIDNVSFNCPKVRTICRQQLISFLKNHGEFFKDRDFHQHVKMLFSGAEDVKEEEEHNEFFHIPEQVPILDVATLFGWPTYPFCQVTYKDFVSTALQLPEVLTCREDLPKVSSSLELVIDQEEPPIKAWSVVREYGNDQAMLSIVPFKKLLITIANSFFVLWNILQPCRICILISAVWLVSQQVNINVLKVICEQTSPDTSGEVCWPTLSRWCALCTRLALIIALPLPIVQCLAGICPLLASISVKGGPSHLLSKFHFH